MKRRLTTVLFTLAGLGLLLVVLVVAALMEILRPPPEEHISKEAQLSNGGILRVHGLVYHGPHGFPYFWDASYQTAKDAAKEVAGSWGGGAVSGDVVACPLDNLVVVNPLLDHHIFVRTASGRWESMTMEIYGHTPPAFGIEYAMRQTSLSAEDIEKLHAFLTGLAPNLGDFRPNRMQFVAGPRELWADFSTQIGTTLQIEVHRVRFKLSADGDHFQLLDIQKLPKPPEGSLQPDRDPDPVCTLVDPFGQTK
jgi:hypothetical protein